MVDPHTHTSVVSTTLVFLKQFQTAVPGDTI